MNELENTQKKQTENIIDFLQNYVVKDELFDEIKMHIFYILQNDIEKTNIRYLTKDSFLGCLPSEYLDKKNFCKYNFEQYFVTIKIDGTRGFLICFKNNLFIVTNKYDKIYIITSFFKETIYSENISVFDCEIIIQNNKLNFYIFDILILYGKSMIEIIFEQRLKIIDTFINSQSNVFKQYVFCKEFKKCNKNNISYLLNKQYNFKTDGLIFQKNDTYVIGKDIQTIKWKPKEICSIDVIIGNNNNMLMSYYNKKTRTSILIPLKNNKIKNFILQIGSELIIKNKTVVECFPLDEKIGEINLWKIEKIRNDKIYPNNISIGEKISSLEHFSKNELLEKFN